MQLVFAAGEGRNVAGEGVKGSGGCRGGGGRRMLSLHGHGRSPCPPGQALWSHASGSGGRLPGAVSTSIGGLSLPVPARVQARSMTHTTLTASPPPTRDIGRPSKRDATDNRAGRRPPRPGWPLAIVLTGQLMAVLDVFIVNIAAPTLRADLHASGAGLQLVIAGYTISYAVLLITGARLGAMVGHRQIFLIGITVFTGASLACDLATSTGQLIAFRFVQGAGAALMLPRVLSLIQRTYTGSSRARALGAYSAVLASGAAAEQILGGVLVEADLFGTGWRPVFLVNVPIGLALLVLGPRLLRTPADPPRTPADPPRASGDRPAGVRGGGLDLPGLVLLTAAVLLFTVPMVLGQERGWLLWGWIMLGLSAVLVALFAAYEARLARHGGALISPRVARAPGMPLAVVRIALGMAANAGSCSGRCMCRAGSVTAHCGRG